MILLMLACADSCEQLCSLGLDRYEVCMEERGLEWGVAYADPEDWLGWCSTWTWEAKQLSDRSICMDRLPLLESTSCEDFDQAWVLP